ncbi:hypothetical protein CYLTODRAFT_405658 [Cylindrobasidium torrendii FP15055 ss-10]|uniref:CxC2-like cysteine cluster KDZ transposase-associated domain-containing protein n=1 Tax=Cylindrobasidium torrendii FP15055 ss-10 TaxID=1314674 RepID=A0A0D7ATT6_9AGAR|nr:hypothetical protein CYLTODRAFT_405658 [Cylindrobasidium torrendii FP15055 ss-10]
MLIFDFQDDPMAVFRPKMDEVLDECFELDHLDEEAVCSTCVLERSALEKLYRCDQCGTFVECRECCLKRHAQSPLHSISEWTGKLWKRVTLFDMGLEVQLLHFGRVCARQAGYTDMVVLHTNGIHRVRTGWCGCPRARGGSHWQQCMRSGWYPSSWATPETVATFQCLRQFRLLNVVGNVNVRDYMTTLERTTNPWGVAWLPDRYKNFGYMVRQFLFLLRVKRSGVVHIRRPIANAERGSLAVKCWACPRPGVNLPEGWEDVQENIRYKYNLFLGLDANFRLENKLRRKAENKDYSVLGDGLGVFAPLYGKEGYEEHVKKYVSEQDVSQCASFAALMQRDTRFSRGLRATGVGGCSCTRHENVRQNGITDLHKGERQVKQTVQISFSKVIHRYSSMDYIWWCAIVGERVQRIMVSYDIGCQWKIHLFERLKEMPPFLQADEDTRPDVEVSLPVWHGKGHRGQCEPAETLRNKPGAAMTEGEGPERIWAVTNQKAYATREMQADTRHGALEDHFDRHNFEMNLRLVVLLVRKLKVALEEREKQNLSFKDVSDGVTADLRQAWMEDIRAWHALEKVPLKDKGMANPYESPWIDEDVSEKEIRQEMDKLEREEHEAVAQDANAKRVTTTASFLKLMLGIEKTQVRSMAAAKGQTVNRDVDKKMSEARKSIASRLPYARRLQARFMPLTVELMEQEEREANARARRNGTSRVPTPEEHIKLWLPSDIPHATRLSHPTILFVTEAGLRRINCSTELDTVRHLLYSRGHLISFRDRFVTGQDKGTRSRTLIEDVTDRLNAAVLRFNTSCSALISLTDEKSARPYRPLLKENLRTKEIIDYKGRAAERLNKVVNSRIRKRIRGHQTQPDEDDEPEDPAAVASTKAGEEVQDSRRTMNWIWTAKGAPDSDEDTFLYDAVRVEWCKAYARKQRWTEEVVVLKEEQRRVVESIRSEQREWEARRDATTGGRAAYAARQVLAREQLAVQFREAFEPKESGVGKKRRRVFGAQAGA